MEASRLWVVFSSSSRSMSMEMYWTRSQAMAAPRRGNTGATGLRAASVPPSIISSTAPSSSSSSNPDTTYTVRFSVSPSLNRICCGDNSRICTFLASAARLSRFRPSRGEKALSYSVLSCPSVINIPVCVKKCRRRCSASGSRLHKSLFYLQFVAIP